MPALIRRNMPNLKLIRYGVFGITTMGLSCSIYLLLVYIRDYTKKAVTVLYVTGTTISYFGNRKLTFTTMCANCGLPCATYLCTSVAVESTYFLHMGVDIYHYSHQHRVTYRCAHSRRHILIFPTITRHTTTTAPLPAYLATTTV